METAHSRVKPDTNLDVDADYTPPGLNIGSILISIEFITVVFSAIVVFALDWHPLLYIALLAVALLFWRIVH